MKLGFKAKLAVTLLAPFITMLQMPVPVQAPLQPVNTLPGAAVGVRVTEEFSVKLAL